MTSLSNQQLSSLLRRNGLRLNPSNAVGRGGLRVLPRLNDSSQLPSVQAVGSVSARLLDEVAEVLDRNNVPHLRDGNLLVLV